MGVGTFVSKAPSHLVKQGHVFYFRQAVPLDMRQRLGRTEFRLSLRTAYLTEARSKALQVTAVLQNLIHRLRTGDTSMAILTDDQIKALADKYLRAELDDWESRRALSREPYTKEYVRDHPQMMEEVQKLVKNKLAFNDLAWIASDADALLASEGLSVPKDSVEYGKLCRALLIATGKWAEIEQKRAQGDYSGEAQLLPQTPQLVPVLEASQARPRQDLGPLLSDALKAYEASNRKPDGWTPRSAKTIMASLVKLPEVLGDIHVGELTEDKLTEFGDKMRHLPARWKMHPVYKDYSLEAVQKLDIPEADRLSPVTLNNIFGRVREFLGWRTVKKYLADPTIKDVLTIRLPKKKPEDKRAPFTPADLEAIFHCKSLVNDTFQAPWKFWVPVLGLFTGARIEELCQLRLEDIRQEDGLWLLDITEVLDEAAGIDMHVKSQASLRKVPLHPFIVEDLKLPAYVTSLKRQGFASLFPMLKKTRETNFTYSHPVSKWFGRHLGDQGVKDNPGEGKKVFHSFRHTVIHHCRVLGINEALIADTVGHEHKSPLQGDYLHALPLRQRFEGVILKLDFHQTIPLDHLKASKFARVQD